MARAPKTTAPKPAKAAKVKDQTEVDPNSLDPDSDEAALFAYFARRIDEAEKKARVKKAEYDELRADVTALFNSAKGELRIPRKRMEDLLEKMKLTDEEYLDEEVKRAREHRLAGLPQLDLFAKRDTASEQVMAYNSGFRAGKAGTLERAPPKTIHPALHQDWMKGFDDGQKETLDAFVRGQALIEARKKKGRLVKTEEVDEAQIDVEDIAKPTEGEEGFLANEQPAVMPPEPDQSRRDANEPVSA